MRTQMLGTFDVDQEALDHDLETTAGLEFGEPYIEFNCGHPWKSCMIWAVGGETGDGVLARYDTAQRCQPTDNGRRLPYLQHLIERFFAVEHLLFARLVVLSNNVLIPHRDYLEFTERPPAERATHRLHVPLATSTDSLFVASNTVYRMRIGEMWSLDVTETHSAAVLSNVKRIHLVLDFAGVEDLQTLVTFPLNYSLGIPEQSRVARPALIDRERDALLGLSSVIDMDNFFDVFGIVIKKNFRADGGDDFVWNTMLQIGKRSGDPKIDRRLARFYEHCLLARTE
jgi:L-proline cis-4-hydroxylase